MDGLILDEVFEQPTKLAVKINFLQHQKDNLQETVHEMGDNIRVYKRIIEQLTEEVQSKRPVRQDLIPTVVSQLTKLNDDLQSRVDQLMEQVDSLKCTILLRDQIAEQHEMESHSVLKNYEDKILQLRRAIQDKEYAIQEKENPRQRCQLPGKKDYIMDPKQEAMRLNGEIEDLKELVRKLTLDNNQLRKKNGQLADDLAKSTLRADKLEALLESSVSYQTARMLFEKNRDKQKCMSLEKVNFGRRKGHGGQKYDISKEETQISKKRSNKVYNTTATNYNDTYFIRNETMTYLRQLLFREKKTSEMLEKALAELNNSYNSLVNSNKLLAESNVNYQVRRSKQQEELNYYKRKNQELLSIIMRRKVRISRSLERTKEEEVLRSVPQEQQVQHNYQEIRSCLRGMKTEIDQCTSTLARITTRAFFQRIKQRRSRHVSYSCPSDYLPRQELDSVEQFIKRQQQKLKKQEPKEQGPFLADLSVIARHDKPITFAQFSSSHGFKKRKLISDSFIQITEEILRN